MKIAKYDPAFPEGYDVEITHTATHAERQKAYRGREGNELRRREASRMRKTRFDHIPEFVGVDSEGIGRGKNHRAVLLGVGSAQYIARDLRKGLQYDEVFQFLYEQFQSRPEDTVYVGFYLGYDFNEWLRSLALKAARQLLTNEGKAARKVKDAAKARYHKPFYPVRVGGWEIDMLGFKYLGIRPRVCRCLEDNIKCQHEQLPWMTICDAGPFFQTSFLKVLEEWAEVRSEKEYRQIKRGKENRATARLSKKMMYYNALENELLARVMTKEAEGLRDLGIKLKRDQWYGPGAVASAWLRKQKALRRQELDEIEGMHDWVDVCRQSYYGGWFEIFSHGIISGETYNYDINSAYPYATTKLPHICEQCNTRRGDGRPKSSSNYMLLHVTVHAKGNRIGPVPHRTKDGSIIRPSVSKGWYWSHELAAANRAGLVKSVEYHEWYEFVPCRHPKPFTLVADLYNQRRKVGKDTPLGKAIKLVINSIYGKFAQSVGGAPYNNWFYASFITSHCRTQILDAIATIPGKASSVLMVATDGICFDKPHPKLPVSPAKNLGEWDRSIYHELVLFKPGVYWHHEGKAELEVKSRGVPAREFAAGIDLVEGMFRVTQQKKCLPSSGHVRIHILDNISPEIEKYLGPNGWPQFFVSLPFHMTSCKQALQRNKWDTAGHVQEDIPLLQSSDPSKKRGTVKWNVKASRLDSIILTIPDTEMESRPYKDPSIKYSRSKDLGFGIVNMPINDILEPISLARDKKANYDIDLGDGEWEWETVWNGGPV